MNPVSDPKWVLVQSAYSPETERDWETLFTLANGHLGLRGAIELPTGQRTPATYVAGLYDKPDRPEASGVFGVTLRNKAITPSYAIAPTWGQIEIEFDGRGMDLLNCRIARFDRRLDMQSGLLASEYHLQEPGGRTMSLRTSVLLGRSAEDLCCWLMRAEVAAIDCSGELVVRFINRIDTAPGFLPRIKDYTCRSELLQTGSRGEAVFLDARVVETGARMCLVSRTVGDAPRHVEQRPDGIAEVFRAAASPGRPVVFTKSVAFATTRDSSDPMATAETGLARAVSEPFEVHLARQQAFWRKQWEVADVEIAGVEPEVQRGLRWCIYNLIQLGNPAGADVSISATGLHGQGYFGHIFWDTEVYLLPFYLATDPSIARSLLLYRYNRLEPARQIALAAGLRGAKYPWTSTATGHDVTPPDWKGCDREILICGAIALGFHNYLKWTGDREFYDRYGVETIIETARYYASRARRDEQGAYHLDDVVGPDEYNRHADDNFFTNHLALWNIRQALADMQRLSARDPARYASLASRTDWDRERPLLEDVAAHMAFPRIRDGVCEQNQGFFNLPDVPPFRRGAYSMPIVEQAHNYSGSSQMSKQADVVMMHYLFEDDFEPAVRRASYEYYEQRCNQGSSLSPAIYSIVGLKVGLAAYSCDYFRLTALLDLLNLHHDKNLAEGIHAACAGGTWAAAVFGFGGVAVRGDTLHIDPSLPEQWKSLRYSMRFRGRIIHVQANAGQVSLRLEGEPIEVVVWGQRRRLEPGENPAVTLLLHDDRSGDAVHLPPKVIVPPSIAQGHS